MRNSEGKPYTPEELQEIFGSLVPLGLERNCCAEPNAPHTIRQMLELDCNNTIRDRNRLLQKKLRFKPIFNLTYEEYRGARMFTYGGVILNDDFDDTLLHFDEFNFIGTPDPYKIEIPNLTYREVMALNQILNFFDKERSLVDNGIVTNEEIVRYKNVINIFPIFMMLDFNILFR